MKKRSGEVHRGPVFAGVLTKREQKWLIRERRRRKRKARNRLLLLAGAAWLLWKRGQDQ